MYAVQYCYPHTPDAFPLILSVWRQACVAGGVRSGEFEISSLSNILYEHLQKVICVIPALLFPQAIHSTHVYPVGNVK
jgi:hypothetical protein